MELVQLLEQELLVVIYKKEISELVSSLFKKEVVEVPTTSSHDYLVVAHFVNDDEKNIPSDDLYTNSIKKFKCEKDKDTVDETCEIYSLTVDTAKKLLNLKTTDANTNVTGKLVTNTYYKLKVDSSKFSSITYGGSYEIELKSNVKGDTKSYGRLKVLAKINDGSLTSDNKLIIAKVKENTITDEAIQGYQCQIGAKQEHTLDCEIYKFTSDLKDLPSLTFANSPTKVDKTLKTDIIANNYYIIDFSNSTNSTKWSNLNKENLKNTIVFVKTSENADNTQKAEFTEAKSFVGKYKETDNKNQVFISYTETAK